MNGFINFVMNLLMQFQFWSFGLSHWLPKVPPTHPPTHPSHSPTHPFESLYLPMCSQLYS